MGLFSSKSSSDYGEAREELERVAERDGYESDDYQAANKRVADSEPWWRRDRG